mmetsp:Transcript_7320/g.20378  ORF Transcript_7320/g.20378 Transcript_7320/m.20378 type:complete len:278 (-) Transcript_7320:15-848(-)
MGGQRPLGPQHGRLGQRVRLEVLQGHARRPHVRVPLAPLVARRLPDAVAVPVPLPRRRPLRRDDGQCRHRHRFPAPNGQDPRHRRRGPGLHDRQRHGRRGHPPDLGRAQRLGPPGRQGRRLLPGLDHGRRRPERRQRRRHVPRHGQPRHVARGPRVPHARGVDDGRDVPPHARHLRRRHVPRRHPARRPRHGRRLAHGPRGGPPGLPGHPPPPRLQLGAVATRGPRTPRTRRDFRRRPHRTPPPPLGGVATPRRQPTCTALDRLLATRRGLDKLNII